ncbi:SDR family oxidoreductase [Micromonospora sp. NBC_01638]|nr:SDR family oxidoreductase [Micromonospora sp. NBC_01638]
MNAYSGRLAGRVTNAGPGRSDDPEHRAGAVAFLASDNATWITGQTIVCDGGVWLTGRAG